MQALEPKAAADTDDVMKLNQVMQLAWLTWQLRHLGMMAELAVWYLSMPTLRRRTVVESGARYSKQPSSSHQAFAPADVAPAGCSGCRAPMPLPDCWLAATTWLALLPLLLPPCSTAAADVEKGAADAVLISCWWRLGNELLCDVYLDRWARLMIYGLAAKPAKLTSGAAGCWCMLSCCMCDWSCVSAPWALPPSSSCARPARQITISFNDAQSHLYCQCRHARTRPRTA
jgi:hypothetical protein